MNDMTITKQLEQIVEEMCDKYCRFPKEPILEGKTEDWLIEDDESPCRNCPLNRL